MSFLFHEIGENGFDNSFLRIEPEAQDFVLCYRGQEALVKTQKDKITLLSIGELSLGVEDKHELLFLFCIFGKRVFLFNCEVEAIPQDSQWIALVNFRTLKPRWASFAAVTGYQLSQWYRSRIFCPVCGEKLMHSENERALICPSCRQTEYPKICPAVIVAVKKGDLLLVTKYAGGRGNLALVAGYTEIGETIEETVRREVYEETGIKVKNIMYYKSQPWSFGDTLLFGFWAEAEGDEVPCPDKNELAEAFWCAREELPENDGVSLTREMMHVFKHGLEMG